MKISPKNLFFKAGAKPASFFIFYLAKRQLLCYTKITKHHINGKNKCAKQN